MRFEALRPHWELLRLHRPIPILLLLWPTYWGLWRAAGGFPGVTLLLIFTVGVFLMRSAGCVLNDLTDQNLDGHVTRTRHRPLVTGKLSSKEAALWVILLLGLSFALVLFLNVFSIGLAFIAASLTLLYPWMKRITHFPQVILGCAFNFGVLMAFAAVQNRLPLEAWLWYGSAVIWTVMYDTIYALTDREDDRKIGIKSTAILFGDAAPRIIILLQGIVAVIWLILAVHLHLKLHFYFCWLAILILFSAQNGLIHRQNPRDFLKAFALNHWVGLLIWIGIL
ncbi:MAG: 4-hydroxybenzoate octaprenyltransferase [Gammaproteobacteria bacterium]|nr:4-hydroxybenzoate octaprenyltransferase [Gammaproteobacteria bacterium]